MDKNEIDFEYLYSELKNPPGGENKDFDAWYNKNLKKLNEIRKTKNGFRILLIILSLLLVIFSFFPNISVSWLRIFQLGSFALMISIWIFLKHEDINPDKELLIMRLLRKNIKK